MFIIKKKNLCQLTIVWWNINAWNKLLNKNLWQVCILISPQTFELLIMYQMKYQRTGLIRIIISFPNFFSIFCRLKLNWYLRNHETFWQSIEFPTWLISECIKQLISWNQQVMVVDINILLFKIRKYLNKLCSSLNVWIVQNIQMNNLIPYFFSN